MNWNEISVTTNDAGIEVLTGVLLNLGISGIRIENAKDFNEFLDGTQTYWDYVDEELMSLKNCETRVIFYIADNAQGADTMRAFMQEIKSLSKDEYGNLELAVNSVCEEDWENNWKKYFKPFEIGSKFLIKPTWENTKNPDNRKVLEIDPGMSFGTGTHETTKLCLETMESIDLAEKKALDLGCGSGILSIGALLLGAKDVTMVDIDSNSVRIASENVKQNGFEDEKITTYCGNITEDEALCKKIGYGMYDVIFANIVADVLKAMSGLFGKFLKSDGTLIVSGIITEREDEVIDKITENGFKVLERKREGAWSCVILKQV